MKVVTVIVHEVLDFASPFVFCGMVAVVAVVLNGGA